MARKLEFDKELALQKAMRLFWEKGFSSASLDDLVQAMGINRFSIYNTFGDKKQLLLLALGYYRETVFRNIISPLQQEAPAKDCLENYLDHMACQLESPAGGLGCFVQRTAQSDIARDPVVRDALNAMLKELYQNLYQVVKACQSEKVLVAIDDPKHVTDFILTQIQGMIFMRRAKQSGEFVANQMNILKTLIFK